MSIPTLYATLSMRVCHTAWLRWPKLSLARRRATRWIEFACGGWQALEMEIVEVASAIGALKSGNFLQHPTTSGTCVLVWHIRFATAMCSG